MLLIVSSQLTVMFHESSKTELSLSLIRSLNYRRFVLWFRAGDHDIFQEDLITTALTLRNELLRQTLPQGMESKADAFYASYQDQELRLELLKIWLKTVRDDDSKVLVVLDDLDGLDPKELKVVSDMLAGDRIDVIFSTRNPSLADPGSFLHATAFEVPPMQPGEASELIQHFMRGNRLVQRGEGGPSRASHARFTANDSEWDVIERLGALPAAIINASHYIRDNLGSNSTAFDSFLEKWDSDDGKSEILKSRRNTFQYPHSMFGSFEVSLVRLKRNTESGRNDLYSLSLTLLQLFSLMDIHEFPKSKVKELCESLNLFFPLEGEGDDVSNDLRRLSQEEGTVYRCGTELVNVSLLSESQYNDIWILNDVVRACSLVDLTPLKKEKLSLAAGFLPGPWLKHISTNDAEMQPVSSSVKAGKRPQPQENGTPSNHRPSAGSQNTLGQGRQTPADSKSSSPMAEDAVF